MNEIFSCPDLDALMLALGDAVEREALVVADGAGVIRFWSRGAEVLLGVAGREAQGQRFDSVIHRSGPGEAGSNGKANAAVEIWKTRDGQTFRITRRTQSIAGADGQVVALISLLRPEPLDLDSLGKLEDAENFHGILTRDTSMKQALQIIRNVAETDATVLVRGESGTGKELVARAIHQESHRSSKPFLAINCASITPSLLESELFGHVRGAFTGALKDHAGLFRRADGGTLFLDEVAELPLELQAKLLRVLQERTFLPVGADRPVTVDVRIVAATHRSLREETKEGRFREDLMYRLRVVPIFLPPLRVRHDDIALLLHHFIDLHNTIGPRHVRNVAPETLKQLIEYRWPGNVREMHNVVEYAFAIGRGDTLELDDLPPEFHETAAPRDPVTESTPSKLPDEPARIREALAQTGGNIEEAAKILKMSRATFWRKRKKYEL